MELLDYVSVIEIGDSYLNISTVRTKNGFEVSVIEIGDSYLNCVLLKMLIR